MILQTHIDTASAQTQCSSKSLAIGKPTRGDKGNLEGLSRTRQEDKVGNIRLAHMARTLKPINTQKVHPKLDRALRMANGRALVQHDTPGLFQLRNDRAGAVTSRLDDADPFVNDGLGVGAVVWGVERGQQGDVDGKGVLGESAALLDLLAEVCWRGEDEGGDDAQTACIGDGGGEFGVADVLDEGVRWGHGGGELCAG